jgi:hypothetical protein
MWNRRHRWIRRLAAGLAFAALVVPTAQARIAEDTGIGSSSGEPYAGYNGYGYVQSSGVPLDQQRVLVNPDDRADRITPGNPQSGGLANPDDRADRITPGNPQIVGSLNPDDRADRVTPPAGDPVVVATPSSGFDWTDAGIGAGFAVGLMLLALGAALATRHLGRKTLARA